MTASQMTIRLFGKKCTVWRVLDTTGEVLQVCESEQEALQWIAAQ